jgi:hypothetical protein
MAKRLINTFFVYFGLSFAIFACFTGLIAHRYSFYSQAELVALMQMIAIVATTFGLVGVLAEFLRSDAEEEVTGLGADITVGSSSIIGALKYLLTAEYAVFWWVSGLAVVVLVLGLLGFIFAATLLSATQIIWYGVRAKFVTWSLRGHYDAAAANAMRALFYFMDFIIILLTVFIIHLLGDYGTIVEPAKAFLLFFFLTAGVFGYAVKKKTIQVDALLGIKFILVCLCVAIFSMSVNFGLDRKVVAVEEISYSQCPDPQRSELCAHFQQYDHPAPSDKIVVSHFGGALGLAWKQLKLVRM